MSSVFRLGSTAGRAKASHPASTVLSGLCNLAQRSSLDGDDSFKSEQKNDDTPLPSSRNFQPVAVEYATTDSFSILETT